MKKGLMRGLAGITASLLAITAVATFYTDTLTGYIYFAVVAVIAWVLYLAVGFMGIGNEE